MKADGDGENNSYGRRTLARWLLASMVIISGITLVTSCTLSKNTSSSETHLFNGLPFPVPEPAPDFSLMDQNNQQFRLSEHQGKFVLLYFGFTHCPDECPATLGIWKQVANRLEKDAEKVSFVMVTVDPERDTPQVMGDYLANFNSDFIGLSGPVETLEDISINYSVYFKRLRLTEEEVMSAHVLGDEHEHSAEVNDEHEEPYLVAHTTLTYLIDESGQLILAYPLETPTGEIVQDLEYLLSQ